MIDRSALSYAITLIEQTYHLNNRQFGLLSSCFAFGCIFYGVYRRIISGSPGSGFDIFGSES
jgi:hypothetical protein